MQKTCAEELDEGRRNSYNVNKKLWRGKMMRLIRVLVFVVWLKISRCDTCRD